MIPSLKNMEIIFLWALASYGGGAYLTDLKPVLPPAARRKLIQIGLLSQNPRIRPHPKSGKKVRANWLALTTLGWGFLEDHLADPLMARTPLGVEIMGRVFGHLALFLKKEHYPLTDIFQDPAEKPKPQLPPNPIEGPILDESVLKRLQNIPPSLAEPGGGFRLRVIRKELADLPRAELDRALEKLLKKKKLVLMEIVNGAAITPEDHAASLTLAGLTFHTVFLRGLNHGHRSANS
jgi:hypothetical protein